MRPTRTSSDLLAAIKANPGKFKASGTGQGGIWHLAHRGPAARPEDRPGRGALGAQQRRRARPAGHGGGRHRDRAGVAARGALADRCRQGQEPGDHERQARRRSTPTCRRSSPPLGSDWTMAAWRGIVAPKGIPPRTCATSWPPPIKKVAASKEYTDFMASRGFGVVYADRRGLRQVHGQVGRRTRRHDEGRGHRQVSARDEDSTTQSSACCCCCWARRSCSRCRATRRSRASRSGRRCFRG